MPNEPTLLAAHTEALEDFSLAVRTIAPQQWDGATPCPDWDVRQLVNHVVAGNLWAGRLARGDTIAEVGSELDGDQLGAVPSDAVDRSAEIARAAFGEPGALERLCAVSYGPVPGFVYLGHRLLDVLVHGWDVRAATGRPAAMPSGAVQVAWEVLEPQLPELLASGAFGPPLEVASDEPAEVRLLCALGRDPAVSVGG